LYVGYLRYHFTKVTTKGSKWLQMNPVYGLHFYLVRTKSLNAVVEFFRKADRPIDDYVTACYPDTYVAGQPLAYQRLSSSSDVTGWADVVNPFNKQIMNPLHLKYLWSRDVKAVENNTKLLHVLPGQRLFFDLPTGWEVKVWQYHDELHDYQKYAKVVPFGLWAVYHYGGMAFPDELSPWLDKHWSQQTINRADLIVGKRGDAEIAKAIETKIRAFNPGFEGGRWGDLLPEKEVAPDLWDC
jgi:hypothetical protein